MRDLLDYIVKQIVSNPDQVNIEESTDGGQVNLALKVDPDDMGVVIGKGGQTIKAIRKLLAVRAMSDNVRINVQLVETGTKSEPEISENSEETKVSE